MARELYDRSGRRLKPTPKPSSSRRSSGGATVRPGEGVYQDPSGKVFVQRDGQFVEVTDPVKVVSGGRGGGSSSSGRLPYENTAQRQKREAAVKAIELRNAANAKKKLQDEITRAEIAKLNKLKSDILRTTKIKGSEMKSALSQIEQQKKAVVFEGKLRTGEILGFSGYGLSGAQLAKRNLLIKTGVLTQTSSIKDIRTVDPLRDEFFIDTKPTKSEKESLNRYIRRKQNEFNTEIKFGKKTPTKKFLDKINLFQKLKNQSVNMENMISRMRKSKSSSELRSISKQFLTEKQKFQINLIKVGLIPINFSKRQANMALLGFSSSIMSFGGNIPSIVASIGTVSVSAVKGTPAFIKKVAKDPRKAIKSGYTVSKSLGKSLAKGGVEFGKLAMAEPGLAIGKIGAEFFIMKGIGKGFKITGKLSASASRPLNPFFKKLKDGKIILRAVPEEKFVVRGVARHLKKRVKKPSFKRPFSSASNFLKGRKPGQFKKFTKDPGIILKTQTVATGASPLSAQAALAGEEVIAVNAAAKQITGWLRRKKIIRKPLVFPNKKFPKGELSFPKRIQKILNKFDDGKTLTKKEFAETNLWLQKNIVANKTLLERSLYADPASGLRLSRLGIEGQRTASLRDILRGNFTLKGSKPQISVFENVRVEKFPKSLNSIKKKILAGRPLTIKETNKLIEWQVKKSGMFKPVGSTIFAGGTELEVTIAPGEIIKRIRKAGFTVVNGKKVPIIMTKIYRPSKSVLKKIKLAQLGKLTKAQLKKLERFLSRQTNSKIRIETPSIRKLKKLRSLTKRKKKIVRRRVVGTKPVLRAPRGATGLVRPKIRGKAKTRKDIRDKTRVKPTGRPKPRAVKRVKPTGRPKPRKPVRGKPRVKPTGRPKPRKPVRGKPRVKPTGRPKPRAKPKPTIPIRKQKFKKKILKKSVPTFYVKEKRFGKVRNLTPRPLTAKGAKDFLAYTLDKNPSMTAYFEPLGRSRNVVKVPPKMANYFSKNKHKFRPYKLRAGKKKLLRHGFLEKRKYALDQKNEKAIRKIKKKKVKRKTSKKKR